LRHSPESLILSYFWFDARRSGRDGRSFIFGQENFEKALKSFKCVHSSMDEFIFVVLKRKKLDIEKQKELEKVLKEFMRRRRDRRATRNGN
jgi:hypothetical protein